MVKLSRVPYFRFLFLSSIGHFEILTCGILGLVCCGGLGMICEGVLVVWSA